MTGGVAHDPVLQCESRRLEPIGVGPDTDTDNDEVGLDRGAVGQQHALDAVLAVEPRYARADRKSVV